MGIEITDEMVLALYSALPIGLQIPGEYSLDEMQEWVKPMLGIVERDYRLMKLCPESLTPDLRCALAEHHAADHGGVTPRGSKVTWS